VISLTEDDTDYTDQ